jgi:hypothetical protein
MDSLRNPKAPQKEAALRKRAEQLRDWLKENGSGCEDAQLHLDEGSPERVYWHYGYLAALNDMLSLLADEKQSFH